LGFENFPGFLLIKLRALNRFLSMATEQQDSQLCLATILEDFLKQRNIQVSVGVDSSSLKKADETCTFVNIPLFFLFLFVLLVHF